MPCRQEIAEEMQPVLLQRDRGHQDEHQQRQRQRHHDVTGECEEQREHAQQIAEQDEEEKREHEREEFASFRPDTVDAHGHDELVAKLRRRLQSARHHRPGFHANPEQAENQETRHHHHQIGLGKIHRSADGTKGWMQLELSQCVDTARTFGRHAARSYPLSDFFGANRRQRFATPAAPPRGTNTAVRMGVVWKTRSSP